MAKQKSSLAEASINDKSDQELIEFYVALALRLKELEEERKEDEKLKEMQAYIKELYSEPASDIKKKLKMCTFVLRRRSLPLPKVGGSNE